MRVNKNRGVRVMQSEQYTTNDGTVYIRIHRLRARGYYNNGKVILLVPCGMKLELAWKDLKSIGLQDTSDYKRDFNRKVDDYITYRSQFVGRKCTFVKYFIKQEDL